MFIAHRAVDDRLVEQLAGQVSYGLGRSFLHGFFDGFGRNVPAYENGERISFRFEFGERLGRAALTRRSDWNFHLERAHLELDIPHQFFMRESLHDARKVCPLRSNRKPRDKHR